MEEDDGDDELEEQEEEWEHGRGREDGFVTGGREVGSRKDGGRSERTAEAEEAGNEG